MNQDETNEAYELTKKYFPEGMQPNADELKEIQAKIEIQAAAEKIKEIERQAPIEIKGFFSYQADNDDIVFLSLDSIEALRSLSDGKVSIYRFGDDDAHGVPPAHAANFLNALAKYRAT